MQSSSILKIPIPNPFLGEHYTELQEKILRVLNGSSRAVSSLEVAHAVGLRTRKEVNPDLYSLEKRGVVCRSQKTGAPVWSGILRQTLQQPGTSQIGKGRGKEVRRNVEHKEVQSSANLSQVPKGSIHQQVLCVLGADPTLWRTELELCCAMGQVVCRAEVRKVLEGLANEGKVMRTPTTPTQWAISNADSASCGGLAGEPAIEREGKTSFREGKTSFGEGKTSFREGKTSFGEEKTSFEAMESSHSTSWVNQSTVVPQPVFSASIVNETNRNPVSALTEYCQSSKIELTFVDVKEFGPPHKRHFVVAAKLGKEICEAVDSTTKKEARRMAADLALQYIQKNQGSSLPIHPILSSAVHVSGSFSDHVAQIVHKYHLKVQESVHYPQPGRKVIAGFVMEDTESKEMKVVSLGSGTRCITGDHMSMEGTVVNDSHAEVIARRSLVRFFYKQMQAYYGHDAVRSIFIASREERSPLLKVRSDLKFHLYISTAPCGDGAQFSRGDETNRDPPTENQHNPTMHGKQGQLRTKIEGGEGTIPTGLDQNPLTWDGVLHGERLRTMSCSDKIGRWNVLGLQGALLSSFMKPVYMSSLTLGSLHHHGHLSRAVCCRFSDVNSNLPPGFFVNHPSLGRVVGGDELKRHTEKTSNFSLNWAMGDMKGELIDGGNGRLVGMSWGGGKRAQNSMPSRVSKLSLYHEFIQLAKLCDRQELLVVDTYKRTKELAKDFQQAKKALFKMCERKKYGKWMSKPTEEEQFDSSALSILKL